MIHLLRKVFASLSHIKGECVTKTFTTKRKLESALDALQIPEASWVID